MTATCIGAGVTITSPEELESRYGDSAGTPPNELIRPIHNRMPVILRPEDEESWLDVSRTSFAKAGSFLKPYLDELMAAHDVSAVANSANYGGPECIQPVSDDDKPSGQLSRL